MYRRFRAALTVAVLLISGAAALSGTPHRASAPHVKALAPALLPTGRP